MSDLIKTSLSLENCSFHPRGERSWAGLGFKNDLALKARVFSTRFGAMRPGPAVRWVPPGYRQLAEEQRAGFLGIHHFHPLRSRHFIIWDHSVKQYDAAHFYLSRFTKPPFSPTRSNKSLGAARRPLATTASQARGGERREGPRRAGSGRAPLAARGNAAWQGPRAQVAGPRVWPGRDLSRAGTRPRPPRGRPAEVPFPPRERLAHPGHIDFSITADRFIGSK